MGNCWILCLVVIHRIVPYVPALTILKFQDPLLTLYLQKEREGYSQREGSGCFPGISQPTLISETQVPIPAGARKAAITSPPPKFPTIDVILLDFSSPCAWGHILLGEGGQYLVPSSLQDAKRRSFEILAKILLQMGKVQL